MTRYRLLLLVVAVIPLTGCESLKGIMGRDRPPRGTGELPPVQPEQLTAYINDRASKMQSLSADVRVTASKNGFPLPAAFNGPLVANQPRNFRMKASAKLAGEVDLGSNDNQFWVYFGGGGMEPMYVFASHTDFKEGKARIPGNMPFEPEWVMQALGMMPLPEGNQYSALPPDQKNRTYTLSWPAVTPSGTSVVKEIVFDGDDVVGSRPQVRKHIVRDKNSKVICSAEIKSAKSVPLTTADPRTGHPLTVQYPTRVVLKWEEQKVEMDLELSNGRLNEPVAPGSTAFVRPTIDGTPAINLAELRERPR